MNELSLSREYEPVVPAARDSRSLDVCVIIVNYRTSHLMTDQLATLRAAVEPASGHAFIVDGGSADGSVGVIANTLSQGNHHDWAAFLPLPINGGFGYANNEGVRALLGQAAPPRYIMFLNPDALVEPDTISRLVEALDAHPTAAAAGSAMVDAAGNPQGSAFHFPSIAREFIRGCSIGALARFAPTLVESDVTVEVDWVSGAAVMVRTEALRQVGLFDEGFFLYFEEVELMHRMRRAGWSVLHVPGSRVRHIGGASTGIADGSSAQRRLPRYWFESRRRYFALTQGRIAAWLASLAWLAGSVIGWARSVIQRSYVGSRAPHEARDLLAHGLVATREDATPHVPAWNSPSGQRPAWMQRRAQP